MGQKLNCETGFELGGQISKLAADGVSVENGETLHVYFDGLLSPIPVVVVKTFVVEGDRKVIKFITPLVTKIEKP